MKRNRIFSIVMAVILVISALTFTALAEETEDTTVTFGVFSDIHKNEVPLRRVMNDLITMAGGKENIDGLALVGDIVYFQKDETPEGSYYNILDENANYQYFVEKNVVSFAMGNHEFPLDAVDTDVCALSKEVFTQETGQTPSSHKIIGGYHFITGEPANYTGVFSEEGEQYVMDEITKALEDGEDKPIFVLIHHPIDSTLFGSGSTRHSDEFVAFLKSQPRVVVFSGHNHYSISNPRAIRQYPGGATFVYTASVHSGNKLNDPYSTERHDTSYPSQAYLMQVDSETNVVTLKRFYVTTDNTPTWVEGGDWVLDIPAMVAESEKAEGEVDLSVYKYTYEERKESSVAPVYNEGDAITLNSVSTKDVSITFPEATAGEEGEDNMVGYYKVDIINKATSETVLTKKYISDYFKQKNRRTSFSCTFDNLSYDTEYTVSVAPVNMWYVEGTPITADFKTGGLPGGFGTIAGYDDGYYAAPATLHSDGKKLSIDTANAFQITAENNKRLAGLYAVSTDDTFETYDITYVYGEVSKRKEITEKNTYVTYTSNGFLTVTPSKVDPNNDGKHDTYGNTLVSDGTYTYVVAIDTNNDGLDDNYTGASLSDKYTYNSKTINDVTYNLLYKSPIQQADIEENEADFAKGCFSGAGGWTNYAWGTWSGYRYAIGSHSHISAALNKAFVNAGDDETKKKTALENIISVVQNYTVKYALTEEEIIPVNEVNSYTYSIEIQSGKVTNSNHDVKFDAYVADEKGNVKVYSYFHNKITLNGDEASLTVDFDEVTNGKWENSKPTEGYLVGFEIWPFYGLNAEEGLSNFSTSGTALSRLFVYSKPTYSIDEIPQVPKPTYLSVDENGKLSGMAEGTVYMYAPISSADMLNGKSLTYTSVNADTTLPAGLYSIKVLGVEGECTDSDAMLFYVEGTDTEKTELPNKMTDDSGRASATGGTLWVTGKMAGPNNTSMKANYTISKGADGSWWGTGASKYNVGSTSAHVAKKYVTSFDTATDDTAKETAFDNIAVQHKTGIYFRYAYDSNEIIPVAEFGSLKYKVYLRQGTMYCLPEDTLGEFRLHVMHENGEIKYYSVKKSANVSSLRSWGKSVEILSSDFTNLPTEGYVIGFEIIPFAEFDAQKATLNDSGTKVDICYGLCIDYDKGMYKIKTAQATPTLTVSSNYTQLTIDNFTEGTTYAYSTNNGETWTEFTTKTLKFTQANKYYLVKALANDSYFESEIATPQYPSAAAVFKGASLVLDGRIGVRIYFDLDKSAAKFTGIKFKKSNETSTTDLNLIGSSWSKSVDYTDGGRTGYITAYISPKDFDNVTVSVTQCSVANTTSGMTAKSIVDSIPAVSVKDYIEVFYKQVQAGNEACIAAEGLVKALEAYCKNADAYFKTDAVALDTVVADTDAIAEITAPSKTTTYTENAAIEHYSTSLILEDTVTIRHYFKINDDSVLEGLTSNVTGFSTANVKMGDSGTKYLYVDVTDIDAANLDNQYTVTITTADSNVISVTYSALNYVKLTYNNTSTPELTKLSNLVKALYNYSVEAEKYSK